jgi:hypothetical protein
VTRDVVRDDLLNSSAPSIRRRRAVIVLSLLSLATTALVALRQTGAIKHLPDPPGDFWDSDKVNISDPGYPFGIPDATVGVASIAANLPLAALGGEDRAESMPLVPLFAAAKSLTEASITLWFNSEMPRKVKKWCPYCLVASALNLTIAALQIPDAISAAKHLGKR